MHPTSTTTTLIIALLLLIPFTTAQWLNNVNVPPCAKSCASILPAECAGNPRCVCQRQEWMIAAQCCVQANCADADHAITEQFAAQLCNYVNAPVNRPTNCPGVSRPQSTTLKSATTAKTTSTTSGTKKPTSTSTSKLPVPTGPIVQGYKYQGCFSEATNGGRILDKTYWIDVIGMTVEKCVAYCSSKGNSLAGLEYTQECWCGNSIVNGGVQIEEGKCGLPCKGNAGEKCGGAAAVGVYKKV